MGCRGAVRDDMEESNMFGLKEGKQGSVLALEPLDSGEAKKSLHWLALKLSSVLKNDSGLSQLFATNEAYRS